GTHLASLEAEKLFLDRLKERGDWAPSLRVLNYSPGYCGWHISGQRKLFDWLNPEAIGIRLNESYLMSPLKSISGVLTAGEASIHRFDNTFPFCAQCRTFSCRERMKDVEMSPLPGPAALS
ncbi:MAG: hypothetical protein GY757_03625, partial [bacterium]|nr:hypothetical protein [bacterium]